MAKNSKMTIEDLAVMVQKGFSGLADEMNNRFTVVENRLEKIELRLDNVAYRFEVQDLERRVTVLEKKAKVA